MTITYTIIAHGVTRNKRFSFGKATMSSGETTFYINPKLRICEAFTIAPLQSSITYVSYPTSFPSDVSRSGNITVITTDLASGTAMQWAAWGRG